MSNMDARAIDAVERAARRYWRSEATGTVELEDIWISERRDNGDLVIRVSWQTDDPRVTLQGDMIYTVSVTGDDLDLLGPEW